MFRPVGEIKPADDTEQHRGDAFDDEQPLPAPQPHCAVKSEQQAGDRRADHGRDRHGHRKGGKEAGTVLRGIPVGQIQDDAGKESGFGDAEQEAQDVEAPFAGDERHRARDDAPGHHDARDPAAGAEFLQRQVARHLEDEIADEEDAGSPGEDQGRELQLRVHGQRGKAEIDAVQIGEEVRKHQERNQPPGDRANGRGLDVAPALIGDGRDGGRAQGFLQSTARSIVVARWPRFFVIGTAESIEITTKSPTVSYGTRAPARDRMTMSIPGRVPPAAARRGWTMLGLALAVIVLGLLLRFYGPGLGLPAPVVKYGGSVLWGTMVFFMAAALRPRLPRSWIAPLAMAVAVVVELIRLVHTPWLDNFRLTLAGALLLGRIFSVWNIVAYAAGVALGVALDRKISIIASEAKQS